MDGNSCYEGSKESGRGIGGTGEGSMSGQLNSFLNFISLHNVSATIFPLMYENEPDLT
ncbi:hypothetical protein D3C75_1346620 [compost metagenome]